MCHLPQAARAEEALDKIKAIKRSEKDLARNKTRTREEIIKLQEKVDNPPEYEAIEPLNEELVRPASLISTKNPHSYLRVEKHQNKRRESQSQKGPIGEPYESFGIPKFAK